MSSNPSLDAGLRDKIMSAPETVLDDKDIMRALVAANERSMGPNIVDLRGLAMTRLEDRLDRLEDTHNTVVAAAYDNLAGTNQINRAVLRILEPTQFEAFLGDLNTDVASILRVDAVRLVLETHHARQDEPALAPLSHVLRVVAPGYVDSYITHGRNTPTRQVTLRPAQPADADIYGDHAHVVGSEACIKLDIGEGRLPGMLVLGAEDPQQFQPQHGVDLLGFFGAVFERALRRWLAA